MADARPTPETTQRPPADAHEVSTTKDDPRVALSAVLPAYNEHGNLTPLVGELVAVLDAEPRAQPYEIVVVDDGSTDGTRERLYHLARLFDPLRAVHLARNFGQTHAFAAGFDHARGDVVVTLDADGQNDPADIPRLLDELERGVDCVSGWRRERRDPWHKRWPSAVQTRLAKRLGPDINDFGCSLKAYRAEAVASLDLWGEGERYIPAQLYHKGFDIAEIEVNHRPRTVGESHYGAGRLVRGFADLLFHFYWNHYSTRPIHLLGGTGLVAMALGVAIGLVSVVQKFAFGVELAPRLPRLVLVALLVIFGLVLLVFGVLAEMLTKLHYRDEAPYRVERVVE